MSAVQKLYLLSSVHRWNGTDNREEDTTAQHSFYVACITGMLADIYEDTHAEKINREHLLMTALYHDIAETAISHITYGAKQNSEILKKEVENIKNEKFESWCRQIERTDILNDKNRIVVYKRMVDFADNLDAWMHCKKEVEKGNYAMKELYENQKIGLLQKVRTYDWAEKFYQKHLLDLL